MSATRDNVFAGNVPAIYERYMVPLIFEVYAGDLVERLRRERVTRVLELAAGTGVVTRALARRLDPGAEIVATDLNPAMIEEGRARGTARPVEWKEANAMDLPFEPGSFDCVVCQFGAMFFPDKAAAFAEARRMLAPDGVLLFNVWDRIEENHFADVITAALAKRFPENPPCFMARTPHGYHDVAAIERDLAGGGFRNPSIETVAATSAASSPRDAAIAYCQGTPMRGEIESQPGAPLEEATDLATAAMATRFGNGRVEGKIQAHVVVVRR